MFTAANKEELCQISLTGIRSLAILGLLIEKPHSLEELRTGLIKYNLMEESHSTDILRIDLNTLRAMGCEISRAGQKTNFKYELSKHPFMLNIDAEEINLIKRAYNKIKDSLDIKTLISFDFLFKKIAEHVSDENQKEELYGLSALKRYNIDEIKQLQEDCKWHRVLKLMYKTPLAQEAGEKEIIAQQVIFKNDKIYIYGFDLNLKEAISLHFKRIQNILSRRENDGTTIKSSVCVKFKLKDFGTEGLSDNETIIRGSLSEGFIIEGKYHNEFLAIQRILSFGANCTVIEPNDFKDKIIESLKNMREIYND